MILSTAFIEIPCLNGGMGGGARSERGKEERSKKMFLPSFDCNGRLYNVNQTLQGVRDTLGACSEPMKNVLETVRLEQSSRSFVSFARPAETSTLVGEERGDDCVWSRDENGVYGVRGISGCSFGCYRVWR